MNKSLVLFLGSISLFCDSLGATELDAKSIDKKLDYISSIRLHDINKTKEELETLALEKDGFTTAQRGKYLNLWAHSELIRGNIERSLEYIEKVKSEKHSNAVIARAEILEATILHSRGEFQKSYILLYQLLDKLDTIESVEVKFSILLNAISRHTESEIFDKSRELARRVLAGSKKYNNKYYNCIGFVELALISLKLGNLPQSESEQKSASLACSEVNNNLIDIAQEILDAKLERLKGNLNLSRKVYESTLAKLNTFGWKAMLIDNQIELSSLYFDMREFDKVEELALLAYEYSKGISYSVAIKDSSEVLAKYYLHVKNKEKADFFRKEYLEAANNHAILLRKERVSYYQAMNYRAKQKESKSKELALKAANQ